MIGPRIGLLVGLQVGIACGLDRAELTPQADISVTLVDSADPLSAGGTLVYTIQVTNNSGTTADNVSVTLTLDASVTWISTVGAGWSLGRSGQVITATKVTVATGAAVAIVVTVTASTANALISSGVLVTCDNSTTVGDTETTLIQREVIFIAGQSNAFGQEYTPNLTFRERTHVGDSFTTVGFRQRSAQTRADPPTWTTDSTGTLIAYTSTVNNNSGHKTLLLGPAQSLGRHLTYYQADHFDVVVFGVSGTDLSADWKVDGTFPSSGGNLYTQMLALMAAQAGRIAAFVWIQGESDAQDAGKAAAYETNLTDFFAGVRGTYPSVPIVFNKLSSSCSAGSTTAVRTAQVNVAAALTNSTMVDIDTAITLSDGYHPDANGYAALGNMLGAAVVAELGLASPVTWSIDPVSLIGVPADATEWDAVMAAAGIASGGPSALYLMQEASGALVDAINAFDLAATGTASYQQVGTGWSRRAVVIANNNSSIRFVNTDAGLPDPASASWTRYMVAFIGGGATMRNLWLYGTSHFGAFASRSSGPAAWQVTDDGVAVVSTGSMESSVAPILFVRDETANTVKGYVDNEKVTGTHGACVGKKVTHGIGGLGAGNNIGSSTFYIADFHGAAAELSDAQSRTLLQTLNWCNTNIGAAAIGW